MKNKFMNIIIFLLFFGLFSAHATNREPMIITTIKPIHLLVQDITLDKENTYQLIPDGASPHHYALKPSDIKKIMQADIIFYIDPQFEIFLNKVLKKARKKTKIIRLMDNPQLTIRKNRSKNSNTHKEKSTDFHIWLDPQNAITLVHKINDELGKLNPNKKEVYDKNTKVTVNKIKQTDKEITQKLALIKDKPFLVFHDAWQYFDQYYGLNFQAAVTLSENHQLGIKRVRWVRQKIKASEAKCLFIEPQFEPKLLATLIKGLAIKTAELDVLGSNIATKEHLTNNYVKILQQLADGVLHCLK